MFKEERSKKPMKKYMNRVKLLKDFHFFFHSLKLVLRTTWR